jgi:hypothetical protein
LVVGENTTNGIDGKTATQALLNSDPGVQVSDTTGAASSSEAGYIVILLFLSDWPI